MKKLVIGMTILAIVLIGVAYLSAEEKPWFDMENCAFCKNMTAEPGLMDHITKWDHFNTADGEITITVIDNDYVDAFKRAMANMDATAERMKAGEKLPMCGMCEAYGAIMMAGAQCDHVESGNIFVSTTSSDKPEVVKMIHDSTDKTNAEMRKMEEQAKMKEMKD